MAGQGSITTQTSLSLSNAGWTVVFTCIPNTPHFNVIAIPTGQSSKQRYPDILAFRGVITKLVEVEIRLTEYVTQDIITRFDEMRLALSDELVWKTWREQVRDMTGHQLPATFNGSFDLVICSKIPAAACEMTKTLQMSGIRVIEAEKYAQSDY